MAACGSIRHMIFDKPLPPPERSTSILNHPIPWNQNRSLTEIFGDQYFKEDSPSSESSRPPLPTPSCHGRRYSFSNIYDHEEGTSVDKLPPPYRGGAHRKSDSLSSESLQHCTEGLGLESSDDMIEDLKCRNSDQVTSKNLIRKSRGRYRRSLSYGGVGSFPPPISSIGRNGKPGVSFKCFRSDGRIILKEVRIPNQDFLHVKREHGRLQLRFVQSESEDDNEQEEEEGNGELDEEHTGAEDVVEEGNVGEEWTMEMNRNENLP